MKVINTILLSAILLLLMAVAPQTASAQSTIHPAVSILNTRSIILDTAAPLSDTYTGSISQLGFQTEKQAIGFFGRISDNLVTYQVNYAAGTVLAKLHLTRAPSGWSVANWNQHIQEKLNSL